MTCTTCGKEALPDWTKRCPSCGSSLQHDDSPPPTDDTLRSYGDLLPREKFGSRGEEA